MQGQLIERGEKEAAVDPFGQGRVARSVGTHLGARTEETLMFAHQDPGSHLHSRSLAKIPSCARDKKEASVSTDPEVSWSI